MSFKIKHSVLKDGDKTQNLKFGEFRYYIQDNPNIKEMKKIKSAFAFKTIFESFFQDYIVIMATEDSENDIEKDEYEILKVSHKDNSSNEDAIINKGYICIMEATKEYDGVGLLLHDGTGYIYKEKYSK